MGRAARRMAEQYTCDRAAGAFEDMFQSLFAGDAERFEPAALAPALDSGRTA